MTRDTLFGGAVTLHQSARGEGYRANVDAILLAAFSFSRRARAAKRAVDLGAGSGAVALSLLHLGGAEHVTLVEIDPASATLAEANLAANGWKEQGRVLVGNVDALGSLDADLVVCNPPYVAPGKGRVPAHPGRARARTGELASFVRGARRVAGRRARICFVYPAASLFDLAGAMSSAGLEIKRARLVHADAGAPARVVLVEALAAKPGGLVIEPPLFEREGKGYGEELRALLEIRPGRGAGPA